VRVRLTLAVRLGALVGERLADACRRLAQRVGVTVAARERERERLRVHLTLRLRLGARVGDGLAVARRADGDAWAVGVLVRVRRRERDGGRLWVAVSVGARLAVAGRLCERRGLTERALVGVRETLLQILFGRQATLCNRAGCCKQA
jgi:hypothetical protein